MTTERKRQWTRDNKDKVKGYELKYRINLRAEMIMAYGKVCQECGIDDPLVLVLDHINDDAQQERIDNKHCGGFHMYRRLKALGWPKDRHQLLCHNCNFRKEYRRRNANATRTRGNVTTG